VAAGRGSDKLTEVTIENLTAYDSTRFLTRRSRLMGCAHHTVVCNRAQGTPQSTVALGRNTCRNTR
jgi:hypothetical protein